MLQYRRMQPKELHGLTALWQQCFGDSKKSIEDFWKVMGPQLQVFAGTQQGRPLTMVCAIPLQLVDSSGDSFSAVYFYALCTDPAHRGKGYATELLRHACALLKQEGCSFACLVPEGEALFPFYENLGYTLAFSHKRYRLPACACEMKIKAIGAQEYQNLRQMQLYGSFADFTLPHLERQRQMSEQSGGGLYRIEDGEAVYCAAGEKHGDMLCLKELLPDSPRAACALAAHLGCTQVSVCTQGTDRPFGMALSLQGLPIPENSYLGLALD